MKKLLFATIFLAVLAACNPKTGQKTAQSPVSPDAPTQFDDMGKPILEGEEPEADYAIMDELRIRPSDETVHTDTLPPYNPSHTFEHDLTHTKIAISFDWAQKHAHGVATLTLHPWFYPTDQLTLDAKGFDIHSVRLDGSKDTLAYTYDGLQLHIRLGRTYTRAEEFKVTIDYTAKPDERMDIGGSAAITSDKGLYFINADGSDPEKPRQIWTQGETESNSCWFPTIDKPNERCTQEMYITVDNKYKTLSNGVLVNSVQNPDGTRTDYWKMDKPHAPYLFMMAIGEYAVVKERWRNIDVEYYVEPKFEPYARDIFPYTPEMLEFFSQRLGYDYPWSKFSQVVVRDYVSGAMENTTAVVFGEFVQQSGRQLLDNHLMNEKIVAHEMFHQWFGDLVTTENWANLTLNEGFANYAEYLWMEHKYGRDAADEHLMNEQMGYLYSAGDFMHPLIHFGYESREDMFDAHSYNKGGCTLHMLRSYLGDDAFFAGLQRYLQKNAYSDVEAHELRLAMEDVSGQDLNWFFNQWFFSAGQPELSITYDWDEATHKALVSIAQTQSGDDVPYIFNLPLKVDIYDASGNVRHEQIRLSKRTQEFAFDAPARPALINVDADKALLCMKEDHHTEEEWAFQYMHAPLFRDRQEAMEALAGSESPLAAEVFRMALKDKYATMRRNALSMADLENPETLEALAAMAENDPDPETRTSAIGFLGETGDKKYLPIFQKGLQQDQPYSILQASLAALTKIDPAAAIQASAGLENDDSEGVIEALAQLYAASPDPGKAPWFQAKMHKVDYMPAFNFYSQYQQFVVQLNNPEITTQAIESWRAVGMNETKGSPFQRFAATKAIVDTRNFFEEKGDKAKTAELNTLFETIKAAETDPTLSMYYGMF